MMGVMTNWRLQKLISFLSQLILCLQFWKQREFGTLVPGSTQLLSFQGKIRWQLQSAHFMLDLFLSSENSIILYWGGSIHDQKLVSSRSVFLRIRAWKMYSLDEGKKYKFVLLWQINFVFTVCGVYYCGIYTLYFSICVGLLSFSSIIRKCTKAVMATIHRKSCKH